MSDSDSGESVTHLNIAFDFEDDPDHPPIFIAARDGDVQALRAELASGVGASGVAACSCLCGLPRARCRRRRGLLIAPARPAQHISFLVLPPVEGQRSAAPVAGAGDE